MKTKKQRKKNKQRKTLKLVKKHIRGGSLGDVVRYVTNDPSARGPVHYAKQALRNVTGSTTGILAYQNKIFNSENPQEDAVRHPGTPVFSESPPALTVTQQENIPEMKFPHGHLDTKIKKGFISRGYIQLTQGPNAGKVVPITGDARAIRGLEEKEQHHHRGMIRDRFFVHPADGSVVEDSGCFTGKGLITMSDLTKKLVQNINIGDEILTFNSDKKTKIIGIIKESKNDLSISRYLYKINNIIGKGLITHDHPILINNIWKRACEVCDKIESTEVLYNFVTKDNLPFIIDNKIILSYGGYAYNIDNNPNNLHNPRSIIFRTRLNNIPFAYVYLKKYFNIEDNNNIIEKSREELDIAHNKACEYVKNITTHKNKNFNIINILKQIEISV